MTPSRWAVLLVAALAAIPVPAPAAPQQTPMTIGAGRHSVGIHMRPGRYYTDPRAGCYWERQSGAGGTIAERVAFKFASAAVAQWVVDVLPGDAAFETNAACGTWSLRPSRRAQRTIEAGVWLVGAQILPGTYRSDPGSGCYWQRLRNFTGHADAVIAAGLVGAPQPTVVTLAADDRGFSSEPACGVWTRLSSPPDSPLTPVGTTGRSRSQKRERLTKP